MNVFGDRTAETARSAHARSIDQAMPAEEKSEWGKASKEAGFVSPWVEVHTPEGQPYYHNTQTDE
eukprot:CAMPEP_0205919542 /NCGR_PEP_ID=MMETSP1325-20131115/10510_1 /ASSEMBLY_ACC=CAM_ASM_000708 /TAXON_ID=236786 /ORGANISM="Florenciella sp., Strain RCC1007" /LENGTH=64 /DNA_ID=CAMNT_0053287163 /DNA_START=19 /DNA_END=210 /DNA_ORIENTATION=+